MSETMEAELHANTWLRFLETTEAQRSGVTRAMARRLIARRSGVPVGSLEGIVRRRLKGVRYWVVERLRAAVVHELEAEISRLTHELEMARTCGVRLDSEQVVAVQTALAAAREVIGSTRDGR